MIKTRMHFGVFILLGVIITQLAHGQKNTDKFEFQFENKTFRGLIESPSDKEASSIFGFVTSRDLNPNI